MAKGKPVPLSILQANLNHARRAQDLFLHTMAERGCGLGVASESYAAPPRPPVLVSGRVLGGAAPWWPSCGG